MGRHEVRIVLLAKQHESYSFQQLRRFIPCHIVNVSCGKPCGSSSAVECTIVEEPVTAEHA